MHFAMLSPHLPLTAASALSQLCTKDTAMGRGYVDDRRSMCRRYVHSILQIVSDSVIGQNRREPQVHTAGHPARVKH